MLDNKYFDYSKLKGKIKEVFNTIENYSVAVKRSTTSINKKLTNKVPFTQTEILLSAEVLGIPLTDIAEYFFTVKVAKTQQTEE